LIQRIIHINIKYNKYKTQQHMITLFWIM
jgi:hypothetical protein